MLSAKFRRDVRFLGLLSTADFTGVTVFWVKFDQATKEDLKHCYSAARDQFEADSVHWVSLTDLISDYNNALKTLIQSLNESDTDSKQEDSRLNLNLFDGRPFTDRTLGCLELYGRMLRG